MKFQRNISANPKNSREGRKRRRKKKEGEERERERERALEREREREVMDPTVPFVGGVQPVDVLRHGIPSLKADAEPGHPLQEKERGERERVGRSKANNVATGGRGDLAMLYGTAFPMMQQIEKQILSSVGRLPGLPSSHLGLEALSGKLDDFEVSDALGQTQDETEIMQPNMQAIMDSKIGLVAPARELP